MPIPGNTRLDHPEEHRGALEIELSADDVKDIEEGFGSKPVRSARPSPEVLQWSDERAKLGTSSKGGHAGAPLPRQPG